jgi:hypothetical protein
MKIFYFFTNEKDMLDLKNIFEQSIPQGFKLEPQPVYNTSFCKKNRGGGYLGWVNKYNTIMKGFSETKINEYFIFSDIDVIFYTSFLENIDNIIKNQEDILFQMETINHDVNIGFMIIKNTEKSKAFWNKIYNIVEKNKYIDKNGCEKIKHKRGDGSGQFIVNDIIYSKDPGIKWSRLPSSFWSRSIGLKKLNKDIYLHHANCANSTEEKLNQISDIKERVSLAAQQKSLKPLKDPVISFGGASISKQEFDSINTFVKEHKIKTVLEFGPGSSTNVFIANQCDILCLENNEKFLNQNKKKYQEYDHIEFILNNQNNITELKHKLRDRYFDLCFIDGPRADLDQYKLFNRIDSYILAFLHAKYTICHDTKRKKDRNSINLIFDSSIYNIEEFDSARGLTLIYKK